MINNLKRLVARLMLAGVLSVAGTAAGLAGDYNGDFMVRAGVSVVAPDADADVFVGGVPLVGANADVSTEVIPSLTLTYFLDSSLAVELFCCFANHDVEGKGILSGVNLGDTWIFPPAVTLQYHFAHMHGVKPYVGAGFQYIAFFDEGNSNLAGGPAMDIDDAFGFTLQAGIDVELGGGWYLNADVKKTWLETEANWQGTTITADVDLDPLIGTVAIGYRFDLFGTRYHSARGYK